MRKSDGVPSRANNAATAASDQHRNQPQNNHVFEDELHGHINGINHLEADGRTASSVKDSPAGRGTKRKFDETLSKSRLPSRQPSPPWKKVAVDGPTSFVVDGRRKSSRTNILPLELQPQGDRRLTRASFGQVENGLMRPTAKSPQKVVRNGTHVTASAGKDHLRRSVGRPTNLQASSPVSKPAFKRQAQPPSSTTIEQITTPPSRTRSHAQPSTSSPLRSRVPQISPPTYYEKRKYVRKVEAAGKEKPVQPSPSEGKLGSVEATPTRLQRIRLKVRPPSTPVLNPGHLLSQRRYASFVEWVEHDDPLAGEDDLRVTDERASHEARVRQRLADAAQPGGVLSRERCSVYDPEPQDEPPQQYGHIHHLAAHAVHFRTLMNRERRRHENAAKKLAHEALERWKVLHERKKAKEDEERRRMKASMPKTLEDILEEEQENAKTRYLQLLQDLNQQWDLVRKAVREIRQVRWEEEQQALGKQALNDMLHRSTRLLDQRRVQGSSSSEASGSEDESQSGEDEHLSSRDAEADEEESEIDSANMSSTGNSTDSDLDEDTNLTVEELRHRYPGIGLKGPASYNRTGEESTALMSPEPPDTDSDDYDNDSNDGENDLANGDLNPPSEDEDTILQKPDGSILQRSPSNSIAPGADGVDLEEVDPILLDDFSNSTDDMEDDTDDSDDSDDAGSAESSEGADSDAGDESDGPGLGSSLLGFLSKADLEKLQEEAAQSDSEHEEYASAHEESQHLRPKSDMSRSASQAPDTTLLDNENDFSTTPDANFLVIDAQSANPSSHPSSMVSTNARPTEVDSASSIEVQESKPQVGSEEANPSSASLKTRVPSLLRGSLREYQHYGLDWLAGLYASNTNGILADEMGLGKTIQTIALLAHLAVDHEVWGPHLVVVPTSVMLNWEVEFKKWCPGFKVLTYYGNPEERKRKRQGWLHDDRWNVCITSYQLVLQDESSFKRRNWHYLILDEAHNIKNFQTQRWQKLLGFKTHSRLLLTGTPLQNNLTELWSLLFFLMPQGFDQERGFAGLQDFLKAVRRPADQILDQGREKLDSQAQETVTKLHEVLRPYLLRRLKADVEKQMPDKYEHVVYCRLSKRQRQLYDGFMGRADTKRTLASGNYMSIINCLMSLRKVCNHPDLFETRQIVTSFAMPKSAIADFEIKELLVRRRLLETDWSTQINMDALNLIPVANEGTSALLAVRTRQLDATRQLETMAADQSRDLGQQTSFDGSSVDSVLSHAKLQAGLSKVDELRCYARLNSLRVLRWPIFGRGLIQRLNLMMSGRPIAQQPVRKVQSCERYLNTSSYLQRLVLTTEQRSQLMETTIQKFGCVTPEVVASDVGIQALTSNGVDWTRNALQLYRSDPFHEARIRLSIAFPDKRLLQYDCGKLQRLEKLLRQLQAGGHRALIFTQMTKVLDILEQFLNIHGYRYLRLDGSTRVEQRQVLTDRFNNDPRILVFILSSRSGGLGINLTGADTVIFYDLDWNPAMDKQCQDRCHRIGQTRDVHIYKFVCEYTIEANILRKSNQKRLLDDVIIQKGDFTTDYFNRLTYKDALDDGTAAFAGDTEAGAAIDKVLGDMTGLGKVLESVEDKEDTEAARAAQKEMVHVDEADFAERDESRPSGTPKTSVPPTPSEQAGSGQALKVGEAGGVSEVALRAGDAAAGVIEDGPEPKHVDEYMLRFVDEVELANVPLGPPPDRSRKKKARKGQEHRIRVRRR